jgi:hypothetical protein
VPTDDEDFLFDGENLASSEPRGFSPDQMVRCEECLRANPPTRTTCLYCASALPVTEQSAALIKPTLRPLEKWEQGFNIIILPAADAHFKAGSQEEVASLLHLTTEDVWRIMEAAEPLPVARAATEQEAQLIEQRLKELGLNVLSVADDALALDAHPQKRVRALELAEDELIAWPTGGGERLRAPWDELTLLLTGRIIVRQIEVEERRGRREENEIVETRELSTDDALLDIYPRGSAGGWRILASNFDFSCLKEKKSLLVAQNFARLLEELRTRASRAEYDDSYARLRHALNIVWPLEQQTESRGWRRGGRRFSTEMVTTRDNEKQFTRYSRLRRYLKACRTDAD